MEALLARAEAHRGWAVSLIEALARLESPSTDPVAVNGCGALLAERLMALGGRVDVLPQQHAGSHVRAEFGGGDAGILMLGHFDTVWPVGQIARMPVRHEAGRLYGPGVFDMKGGIAIAMLAVRTLIELQRLPRHKIVMLWTTDEEVGSATSRALLEREAARSRAVLVLEPALPGGAVKTARKGVGEFTVTATGVPAHAGIEPGRGASAIHELAWQITRLLDLEEPARGLTLNVGTVRGGSRPNVVAESAAVEVDVRIPTSADVERVAAAMARLSPRDPRVRLMVTGGVNRPPLERSAGVAALYEQARQVALLLGRDLAEGETGGGSDGNFTAALGVPTLDGLGAVGGGAHALDEHVELDSLAFRAALVAGLLLRLE